MYTYIKINIPGKFIELPEKMSEDMFSNLGETYQDYLIGKYVLLSKEQTKFHEENPSASPKEVWEMQLIENIRTPEIAKSEMIAKIDEYDNSENVNGFTINNVTTTWFSVQERLNYKQSVESAKLLNVDKLSFFVGDNMLEIKPEQAEQMLAALQLYADSCFIVTKQHKLAVEELGSVDEIDNYDYKSGYPSRLNFDLL